MPSIFPASSSPAHRGEPHHPGQHCLRAVGMLLGPLGGWLPAWAPPLRPDQPYLCPRCWLTFLTKGAMGLAAGLVFRTPEQRETASYRRCLASSLVGCLTYYLLYFSKSLFYDNMLVGGLPVAAAALLLP
ncbi:MAG: hypothetical protein ACLRWQ_21400 [Flavonifractor plautii]